MTSKPRKLDIKAYAILMGAVAAAVFVIAALSAQFSLNFPRQVTGLIQFALSSSVALFAVALVLGAIAHVRERSRGTARERDAGIDALEIARRRYARGEIDQEEFRRLRDDLQSAGDEPVEIEAPTP